jgi:hypothetical protein
VLSALIRNGGALRWRFRPFFAGLQRIDYYSENDITHPKPNFDARSMEQCRINRIEGAREFFSVRKDASSIEGYFSAFKVLIVFFYDGPPGIHWFGQATGLRECEWR